MSGLGENLRTQVKTLLKVCGPFVAGFGFVARHRIQATLPIRHSIGNADHIRSYRGWP
jgi:hypothetical protein